MHLSVICLVSALSLAAGVANNGQQGFIRRNFPANLQGPYCSQPVRPGQPQCCENRDDDCSRPIYGTLCYCDKFCDIEAMDCCPDYYDVCRGGGELRRVCTTANGTILEENRTVMDNCNECTCRKAENEKLFLQCERDVCLMRPKFISQHNRDTRRGWTATDYQPGTGVDFFGKKLSWGLKNKLGVLGAELTQVRTRNLGTLNRNIPRSYDLRRQGYGVSGIRNQGMCGASWAYATAGLITDKMISDSAGQMKKHVSAQHLIDCNRKGQLGCDGGYIDRAALFFKNFGGVSDECYPEKFRQEPYCPDNLKNVLSQKTVQCSNGFVDKSISASIPYRVAEGRRIDVANIQVEIMERGSVLALLRVESDFYMYKDGVYRHDPYKEVPNQDHPSAYHAVRIVGWGDEDGTRYWICANSWGTSWGENGYFRIVRGANHCDIEKFVIAIGNINYDNTLLSRKFLALHRSKKLKKHRRRIRSVVDLLERDPDLKFTDVKVKNEDVVEKEFRAPHKHHGGRKHQKKNKHQGGKHHKKNHHHNQV